MRILLINPPYIGWLNDIKVEPIGLLYIASFLRSVGHDVDLYDPYIGEPEAELLDKLRYWRPQIVGCAVHTVNEAFCFDMARHTKQFDPRIVFVAGGPHATFTSHRMLSKCKEIDIITHYESEETMASIAQCVEMDKSFSDVAGISFEVHSPRDASAGSGRDYSTPHASVVTNPFQRLKSHIDNLPFPARDLLSGAYYEKYHATGVITSRGCAYRCDFCVSPAFFNGVRQREVGRVAHEIQEIMSQRDIRHIRFYDDVFAYDLRKIRKVKEFIGPLGLTYDCYIRVDVTTTDMLEAMKESGCVQVRFGVESGLDKMRSLRKGGRTVSFQKHAEIVEKCREMGIETLASYIFGFPDDTRESILETIAFADQLNTDRVGFYKLTPYPGTIYWHMLDDEQIRLDDYTKFDNKVSVNAHMSSEEIFEMLQLAYVNYYEKREIPYENPDTLRFLTSLPKLRY